MNPEGNLPVNSSGSSSGNSVGWPAFAAGRGRGVYPLNQAQPGMGAVTAIAAALANQYTFPMPWGNNWASNPSLPIASTSSGRGSALVPFNPLMATAASTNSMMSSTMNSVMGGSFCTSRTTQGQQAAVVPWRFEHGDVANSSSSATFQPVKDECAICTEKKIDLHMFFPCEHYPYCSSCMKQMSFGTPGIMKCPHCKQRVEVVRRVSKVEKENSQDAST